MRTITILALLAMLAISPATARAATPGPSSSTTATPTPATTPTPAVTPSAVATPQATSTPAAATPTPTAAPSPVSFTLSGRLVVDVNSNGGADAADAAPVVAGLNLVPWSTVDRFVDVRLFTASDGSFAFEQLPPDSYTLRVFWPFGFTTKGASPAAPGILRAAFTVTDTGEIVPPNPLPKVWPGSLEPFVPDEPILGRIPDPILLNRVENPNIATFPIDDAGGPPPPVGRVDVSAALRGRGAASVGLPPTGSPSSPDDGWAGYLILAGAAAVAIAGAAALVLRRARALSAWRQR